MSAADCFFDTNVLLYLLSKDAAKADLAQALLATGGVVSAGAQWICIGRHPQAGDDDSGNSRNSVNDPSGLCRQIIGHWDPRTWSRNGRTIYGFSIYDGLIVASAVRAGSAILCTEDLQQGQVIDQVTIQNPFAGS
jgi:predicted nucleic acid-binding protein